MQYRNLSNGVELPMIGYGTFQIKDAEQCERCVSQALEAGYRLFDTAASYENEASIGAALRSSGIPREGLFITTKLWVQDAGYDGTLKAFDSSLKQLGLDYIDLYLIHQPFGDYYGAWRAMERLYREGAVRAIGVSNFTPERLVDLCMNQEISPMVNQIEIHPFFQQNTALRVMEDYGVVPQAWGPFSEAQKDIFHHRTLAKIADKQGRTTAQVILRWHLQRGIPTIPKTVQTARMTENLDIFDFELTAQEMERIAGMDIGHSEIVDHSDPKFVQMLHQMKIHQ